VAATTAAHQLNGPQLVSGFLYLDPCVSLITAATEIFHPPFAQWIRIKTANQRATATCDVY
jgi:hypothetical protein